MQKEECKQIQNVYTTLSAEGCYSVLNGVSPGHLGSGFCLKVSLFLSLTFHHVFSLPANPLCHGLDLKTHVFYKTHLPFFWMDTIIASLVCLIDYLFVLFAYCSILQITCLMSSERTNIVYRISPLTVSNRLADC